MNRLHYSILRNANVEKTNSRILLRETRYELLSGTISVWTSRNRYRAIGALHFNIMRLTITALTFIVTYTRICVFSKTISRKSLQTATDLTSSFLSNTQIQNFMQGGLSGLSWPQITNLVKGIFSEIEDLEDSLEDMGENFQYSKDVGIGLISTLGVVLVLSIMGAYRFWGRIKGNFKNPFPFSLDNLRRTISEFLRIRTMDISGGLQIPSMGPPFNPYGYQMNTPTAPTSGPPPAGGPNPPAYPATPGNP